VIEVWVPHRQLPPGQTLVPGTATESGGTPHRYVWPSEMHVMAKMAGLALTDRHADWNKSEFTGDSKSSISVWTKPAR
jgi:hypothetical protein